MKNKKKVAAVAVTLAAAMSLGALAGCNLETTDSRKDMAQTIAEVNITNSARFQEEFGGNAEYEKIKGAVKTASVSKRDMMASFLSNYSSMSSYVSSYGEAFKTICDSLVDRNIYIQYATAYLLANGFTDEDGVETSYSVDERNSYIAEAVKAAEADKMDTEVASEIAGIAYFLSEDERNMTEYSVRTMFNNSLDSQEKNIIVLDEDETEYESTVRTLPTGVNTADEDYCDTAYKIYTGTGVNANASDCGSYETVEGSTPTTRKTAYGKFLSNLRTNDLLGKGEDTSDVEKLAYYQLERKNAYESALIGKINESYTTIAYASVTKEYSEENIADNLKNQKNVYAGSVSTFETDLDAMSDTKFVLTTPGADDRNYGFVINILLPFSAKQSEALSDAEQDFGDGKGNKFATRASLLENVKATDQRGSWFTGETDHSFTAEGAAYKGSDPSTEANRTYLFFEDSLKEGTTEYQRLKNYLGQYTYNGTYNAEKRVYTPNKIDIDGFIGEMEGYLKYALGDSALTAPVKTANYYKPEGGYYKADGTVDYTKLVYYSGKVDWNTLGGAFDANKMFLEGSNENKAMSVINELSFAYNTDTAGLNTYLGYAVTANKTNFVSEFEYAAQWAVQSGAGSYVVVPSDYGWHVIYCTFSFADTEAGKDSPFTFVWDDRTTEGTFSYLYYEALKANALTNYSTNRRSRVINAYSADSSTVYEDRFSDLTGLK